jgi:hypothetical protein
MREPVLFAALGWGARFRLLDDKGEASGPVHVKCGARSFHAAVERAGTLGGTVTMVRRWHAKGATLVLPEGATMTEFEIELVKAVERLADAVAELPTALDAAAYEPVDYRETLREMGAVVAHAIESGLSGIAHALRQASGNAR